MDRLPSSPQAATDGGNSSKLQTMLRAIGLGALVLILWFVDKLAVAHLPEGSAWRYVIGAIVISVGLAVVILITDRLSNKDS